MKSDCNIVIESIGTYLPPQEITTAEVLKGCVNEVRMPLERLTGIKTRRRAGTSEFAIDLAYKAALDCLSKSSIHPHDVDLIVSTNISRWDGVNQIFFEPPTSLRLKTRLGFRDNALAIDISNACAGMWTGVYLVETLIRSGQIRHGMVVSGEYITHLIDTAQKEVVDFVDSQIASLTLGDAGAAIILSRSKAANEGMVDFDLYTLSRYSPFCIAKPTDKAHGGASMITDAIRVTEAVIPHAAKHTEMILKRNQWANERVQHLIPHQTSELTMKAGMREIKRLLNFDFSDRIVNNLAHRGNTSSNAHFLALHDFIQNGKINAGDSIVFCISGSGQSTGTAIYTMDDLPTRMRIENADRMPPAQAEVSEADESFVLPVQLSIESISSVEYSGKDEADTVQLITEASEKCFAKSAYSKQQVDIMIAACTYRSEFIMEPAIAALAAGVLAINDVREPADEHKTFAFDIVNGEVGFLKSVFLASEFVRVGRAKQVMVVASEVENNITRRPDHLLDVRTMASSVLLHESSDDSGFLAFEFTDYPQHVALREVHAGWHGEVQRIHLTCDDKKDVWPDLLDCLIDGCQRFMTTQSLSFDDVTWVLPTQHSTAWINEFATRMTFNESKLINLNPDKLGNPFSSAFPLALINGLANGQFKSGETVLIASVSPGAQVACALYRV